MSTVCLAAAESLSSHSPHNVRCSWLRSSSSTPAPVTSPLYTQVRLRLSYVRWHVKIHFWKPCHYGIDSAKLEAVRIARTWPRAPLENPFLGAPLRFGETAARCVYHTVSCRRVHKRPLSVIRSIWPVTWSDLVLCLDEVLLVSWRVYKAVQV